MRRGLTPRARTSSAGLRRSVLEVGGHVVAVEEVDQRLRASARQCHHPATVLGRSDHRQWRDDLCSVPTGLAEVTGTTIDPAHQVELGVLGNGVVDGSVQGLCATGATPIDQRPDRVHHGQLASDVVRLPHLRGDRRSVVGAVRLRIIAAVHHRPTERQMDEVGTAIAGPRTVVAKGRHPGDHNIWIDLANCLLIRSELVDDWFRTRIEKEVGRGEQLQKRRATIFNR